MSATLDDVVAVLRRIEAKLGNTQSVADSSFDPKVFTDPKEWLGDTQKDKLFSDCPPDFLIMAAEMYDRFAFVAERENTLTKNGKPKCDWHRKLAASARHYAAQNKNKEPVVDNQNELPITENQNELPF